MRFALQTRRARSLPRGPARSPLSPRVRKWRPSSSRHRRPISRSKFVGSRMTRNERAGVSLPSPEGKKIWGKNKHSDEDAYFSPQIFCPLGEWNRQTQQHMHTFKTLPLDLLRLLSSCPAAKTE